MDGGAWQSMGLQRARHNGARSLSFFLNTYLVCPGLWHVSVHPPGNPGKEGLPACRLHLEQGRAGTFPLLTPSQLP